jgi:tRNA pseudouridine55 synthase
MSGYHGLLVIDKPAGITSRDAVNRVQRWFPRGTKIGHTGTLDPLATGVLVVCIGSATRLAEYVQLMTKTYRAEILLGARSDTDDADGTVTPVLVECPPSREQVEQALSSFVGAISQTPPAFSATKVAGRRAHDLARAGEEVSLSARTVLIDRIDILAYDYPRLGIEVRCGKGTYIRSLARDLGDQLGCGGYIEALRRLSVGPFSVADALTLETDAEAARARLLPVAAALADQPRIVLSPEEVTQIRNGRPLIAAPRMPADAAQVAAFDDAGGLVAICRVDGDRLQPSK